MNKCQYFTNQDISLTQTPPTVLIPNTVLAKPERLSRGGGNRGLLPSGKAGQQPHHHHHHSQHPLVHFHHPVLVSAWCNFWRKNWCKRVCRFPWRPLTIRKALHWSPFYLGLTIWSEFYCILVYFQSDIFHNFVHKKKTKHLY